MRTGDRKGPVATGRPAPRMSPGLRLGRRPPPWVRCAGLSAATGHGSGPSAVGRGAASGARAGTSDATWRMTSCISRKEAGYGRTGPGPAML